MTLELNIFNTMKKPSLDKEEDAMGDGYLINTIIHDHVDDSMTSKLEELYQQPTTLGEGEPPDTHVTRTRQ